MPRVSVATIDSPEFVNITKISPLISKCEVKVLYIGENRNRSFITKEVATEMAQSLPGCPIVGYYIEKIEDFGDHGDQIIIDVDGVKFNKLTKPYGFIDLNTKIWFQKFEESDDFGNSIIREYLMTEGYLWTGQFEECRRVIDDGNPQSMELDEKNLKGHWSTDINRGVDFFIINDAIFSKLCILGEDIEPCFEGAEVTAPKVSSSFSKDDNFTKTLFTMLNELKFALNEKGGNLMDITNQPEGVEVPVVETPVVENTAAAEGTVPEVEIPEVEVPAIVEPAAEGETTPAADNAAENFSTESGKADESSTEGIQNNTEEFSNSSQNDENSNEDKEKFELLQKDFQELQSQFSLLKEQNELLVAFRKDVEDKEKDALIKKFFMLDDEDKKDVIENKSTYSLDEIEAKLSVVCVRKKVSFDLGSNQHEDSVSTTFNLNSFSTENSGEPAWIKAVEATKNRMK